MVKPLDSYVVCKIVTLREMGLSYKENKEKLGLKSRSTAQTANQRFLRTNSYVAKKPPCRPEKLSEKGQRLIVRRVEKDPKTTLERVRVLQNSFSSSKTVSKCTIRRILKKYGIVSRKAAKKFNLNKKQRLIRKRWCSRMLKKPLGFYPASIFHRKWKKALEFFEEKILEKTLKVPKKPKRKKKFLSN